mgnify:CR=1 FL=1
MGRRPFCEGAGRSRDGADRFGWGLMIIAEGQLSLMARKWKGTSIPQCLLRGQFFRSTPTTRPKPHAEIPTRHVQQMHSTPAPATRHCAPRKILLGRSGTHSWDTLRCTLSPRCCCSPCTSRTQPLAVERSEPSASQSCPIPPARAPERSPSSPSSWAVAPIPELPRSQLYPSSSLLPRLQLQHQSSPHPSQQREDAPRPPPLPAPLPRCRVVEQA